MLHKLKNAAYEIYSRHFTFATLIEGTLAGDNTLSRSYFVMDRNSPFENYLLNRLYGTAWRKVKARRFWVPALSRLAHNLPDGADFCIAVLPARWNERFSRLTPVTSPSIVRQVIDMSGDWADIKRRFLESRRKTIFNQFIRDTRYIFRISHERADFDYFYDSMYCPHVRQQFAQAARIEAREELARYFDTGFMMMLRDGEHDVAGSLCFIKDDTMFFHRGGVLDGNEDFVRDGAQTALYVSMLRHAKDQNLRRLDLGHSRAFFNDGVYRHKRSWGASVTVDEDLERWLYFFNPHHSERGRHVLQRNPMIIHTPSGLMAYCAFSENANEGAANHKALEKLYYSLGIKGMYLSTSSSSADTTVNFESARSNS